MAEQDEQRIELIKKSLGEFPDFPKAGINFKDLFTALTSGEVCVALKDLLISYVKKNCPNIDAVVGLDARGFLFSLLIASELGIACIPIRKKGKLPGECFQVEYELEYGTDIFELQCGSIKSGQNVLIIDDLLATGGTISAAEKLIKQAGGIVDLALVIIELTALKGRDKTNCKVHSFIQYDD